MTQRNSIVLLCAGAMLLPTAAQAGITLIDEDGKYLELGGRLQAQYETADFDSEDETTDDFFFRRLRFYIEGSVTENWLGKWQVDFSGNSQDPEVRDAYIVYAGFDGKLTIGNHKAPFSREILSSSKRQQLVERTFVGDHNFGIPDRQIGVSYGDGGDVFSYRVGLYEAGLDGDTDAIDFESTAGGDSEYTGRLIIGRVDIHPGGPIPFAQGDFGEAQGFAFGINAYTWSNDDDTVFNGAADYDDITGVGVDAAYRGGGFSIDTEYNTISAETVGNMVTTGIIEDGDADLDTFAVEGGFMFVPNKWEVVAGYEILDADAFDEEFTRTSVGINHFFNKHKDKLRFTVRSSSDVNGVDGDDAIETFLQLQHTF